MDIVLRDIRYAIRSLRGTPGFTVTALLTLALGIGATTAIFSVVNSVVLRPLPYPKPEQLLSVTTRFENVEENWFAVPEYIEFRDVNRSFSSLGAYVTGEVNLFAGDPPRRVRVAVVDSHLLHTLGIPPAQGRWFMDTEPENHAILSHDLWQAAFGGQPVLGRRVEINGEPFDIVGIMPPGADLMDRRIELWIPLAFTDAQKRDRGSHNLWAIGRLRDGVTPQQAQAEIDALMPTWSERFQLSAREHTFKPLGSEDAHTVAFKPLARKVVGDANRAIWILQAAVGVVLLIVCVNLANLLLARAQTRRHEFALRAALGAGSAQLFRQTVTEGLLLSLGGGVLGVWVALVGVDALVRAYPNSLPRTAEVSVDMPVLLFALVVSIAVGILFGLVPAARNRVANLLVEIQEGANRSSSAGRHYVRRALVIGEIAMAVVLVIAGGLLARTVYNLTQVDIGFDPTRRVTFGVAIPAADQRRATFLRLLDDLRAVPGVQSVGAMAGLPPDRPANFNNTSAENYRAPDGKPFFVVDYDQYVLGNYFGTMDIPMVAGRPFDGRDAGTARSIVVNEALARKIWGTENPIGRHVRRDYWSKEWFTVVGVARDVKQGGVDRPAGTEMYFFAEQEQIAPPRTMNVVLRTTLDASALASSIGRVVHNIDPTVPIVRLRDMDDVFTAAIGRPRLLAQLLAAFAGLALLLAAIGTYGVLSYIVAERRREIGIRLALGATRSRVVAFVGGQGLILTLIGIAIGLLGALMANGLIAPLLFGVEPTDRALLVAVAIAIACVAALASWLPALRASRVDPNVVLRAE
jgi:predicted permease